MRVDVLRVTVVFVGSVAFVNSLLCNVVRVDVVIFVKVVIICCSSCFIIDINDNFPLLVVTVVVIVDCRYV